MNNKLIYITLLSTILIFAGCAKEDNMQIQSGSEATLLLNVPTRAVGAGDDEITEVRIVSFVPQDASNGAGWMDVNGGKKALEFNSITQTLKTGVRDVYVFANETVVGGLSAKLNGMHSLTDLNAIKLPYSGPLAPPFLCSYVEPKLSIEQQGNPSVEAEVVRAVSMVNLTLNYEWGEGKSLPEELVIDQVQVKHLPKYSYLVGRSYDGGDFIDSEILSGADLANQSTNQQDKYKSGELVIYIPEFIGASVGGYSFIEIIGHPKSNSGIKCKYEIPLGDGIESDPMTDYDITRNTAFVINATINRYGETDNISIQANVVDWNEVNTAPEVGGIVKFEKAAFLSNDVGAVEESLARGGDVPISGGVLTLSYRTNVGGWYAITRDIDGNEVAKSQPTAAVTNPNELTQQSVTIPISPLDSYDQEYTVSIHHSVYASNLSIPIDNFRFKQYGCFIPNSVLRNGVIIEGERVKWPEDKLPDYGLQIAKIGNVFAGVAMDVDPELVWSTRHDAPVAPEGGLGFGKSNYAVLKTMDPTDYPIGQVCKDLGPEWYVPSVDELRLIYPYNETFSASYTFNNDGNNSIYWSSTDGSWLASIGVSFFLDGNGSGVYEMDKMATFRVRCVRNI